MKFRTQRSMSQRLLPFLLAQDEPDQEDLVQVVQSLNSELTESEDSILKTDAPEQVGSTTTMRGIDDVDAPPESTKKRARVSLSPS